MVSDNDKVGPLFSTRPSERNREAIRLLDSGDLDQKDIVKSIIDAVLCDGNKAEVGTLVWTLWESKRWDGDLGKWLFCSLAVCGNYEVRHHCMQLLGYI